MIMSSSNALRLPFGRFWPSLLLILSTSIGLKSIGIPNVHIDQLVVNSDVIAICQVSDVRMIGAAPAIEFRGRVLKAAMYSGDVLVHRTIKGVTADHLRVEYALPLSFVGYHGLHTGTRIVFLRGTRGTYGLADPYFSDFPAVLSGLGSNNPSSKEIDYTTEVIREMLNVISSPNTSASEKSEILRIDYALPRSAEVVEAFRAGVANTQEPDLRQRLQGELISFGDLVELPNIVALLLNNTATADERTWLLYVVGNRIRDSRAIVELRPLLRSNDARLREAAAQALWNIGDSAALKDLAFALHDPDPQVRFYTVRALSDIANEPGWGGPGESQFREHEQEYLTHWQNWAKVQLNQ